MNLQPGDYVVHPAYGVGTVITIEEMNFAEKGDKLFYRVDFDKTTIWVPVQIQQAGGVRPIIPKRELPRYRSILKSTPVQLSDDFRDRQVELETRVKQSSFQAICEIVRDLYARGLEKTLSNYEVSLLKRARHSLVEEWAAAGGVTDDEAIQEIDAFLADGKSGGITPNR